MVEKSPAGVKGAAQLKLYWEHGKGSAKIAWGTPGDYDRCVVELSKYVPTMAHGLCENMHEDVLGISTAEHAKLVRDGSPIPHRK